MAATAAAGGSTGGSKAEEVENLLASVRGYATLLYGGTIVGSLAPLHAMKLVPHPAPHAAGPYNFLFTAAIFAAATALLLCRFARVLERKPAPAPRLTALAAWPLALGTWGCLTVFFVSFLAFCEDAIAGRADWAVAAAASLANLAMAARTVAASPCRIPPVRAIH